MGERWNCKVIWKVSFPRILTIKLLSCGIFSEKSNDSMRFSMNVTFIFARNLLGSILYIIKWIDIKFVHLIWHIFVESLVFCRRYNHKVVHSIYWEGDVELVYVPTCWTMRGIGNFWCRIIFNLSSRRSFF